MSDQIFASSSTSYIYDEFPIPYQEAIINGVFSRSTKTNKITQSLVEASVNTPFNQLRNYWEYGRYTYVSSLVSRVELKKVPLFINGIINRLLRDEPENSTIELIDHNINIPTDEVLNEMYLYANHGYNWDTNNCDELDPTIEAIQQQKHATFITTKEAELQSLVDNISVPANRVVETATTYQGQSATLVEEYTVTVDKSVLLIPTENMTNRLSETTVDVISGNIVEYTFTITARHESRALGVASLSYQEDKTTYYRFANASTTEPTVDIGIPVVIELPPQNYSEVITNQITDTHRPYIADVFFPYFFARYVITTPDQTKYYRLFLSADDRTQPNTKGRGDYYPYVEERVVGDATDFLPILRIRKDNVDRLGQDTQEADHIKKMLLELDLDPETVLEQIQDNPNEEDVDDVLFMFSANLNKNTQSNLQYLWFFFKDVYKNTEGTKVIPVDPETNTFDYQFNGDIAFELRTGSATLKYIHFGIGYRVVQGIIGKPGTVEKEVVLRPNEVRKDILFLRKQLDDDTYGEIRVNHPMLNTYVHRDGFIQTTLAMLEADNENEDFIIPLSWSILDKLTNAYEIQQFFYETQGFTFYSYERVKLKWYQEGIWKGALIVTAVISTIVTGVDFYSTVTSLVTAGKYYLAVTYVLKYVLTRIVVSYAFRFVAEQLGYEIAMIISAALFAAGMYSSISEVTSIMTLTPDTLLQLSVGLANAVVENIQDDIITLQNELSVFQDEAESLMDELEEKRAMLEPSKLLNPFLFIGQEPLFIPFETPTEYFDRQLATNLAGTSYSRIENFVDTAVSLPRNI